MNYIFEQLNQNSWVAEFVCDVSYYGSAFGKLASGSYLVIRKPDNSISVQAGDKNLPRNYLRALEISTDIQNCKIICTNKKERLVINVHEIKWIQPTALSLETVVITNSEKQLVDKFEAYVKETNTNAVTTREFVTEAGKCDLVIEYIGKYNYCDVFEAKRRKASLADIFQLRRYSKSINKPHQLYLMAPGISKNAEKHLESNNVKFIKVTWDDPIAENSWSLTNVHF